MAQYKYRIQGKEYCVNIASLEGDVAQVEVNGKAYRVELEREDAGDDASPAQAPVAPVSVSQAPAPAEAASAPVSSAAGQSIVSPLPGVIIDVCVSVGQAVKAGQKVAVLEAMKMENEIQATADGTVTAVLVQRGDSVLEGAALVKIS